MISMGKVWDRAMEVMAGRAAIIASIAFMLLFAPSVAQAAIDAVAGASPGLTFIGGLIGLVVALGALIGTLAITAVATDPAVDQRTALAIGGGRIGPMFGIGLVLMIALFVSAMPAILLLGTSGFDVDRARAGLSQDTLDLGRFGLAMLFFLMLAAMWFWIAARLVPLVGVVVNERRGLGALRRSFALSRGSALKLIGVLILYSIVLAVVLMATTSIVGLIVRLLVGPDAPGAVGFGTGVAAAAVTAVSSVVQAVFSGQFYVAARDVRDRA
jgi:hypothetical protein